MTTKEINEIVRDYRICSGELTLRDAENYYTELLELYIDDREQFNTEIQELKDYIDENY